MTVVAISSPTDEQLLRRFTAGDSVVLDELFRRYRVHAYRVAYRLLGNEFDAHDAVQDGFIKALINLERFRGTSSFKTWLLRIVCNAALDHGRRRRRYDDRTSPAPFGEESVPTVEGPPHAANLERADLRRLLDWALEQLPEVQRQTFVLHADGEMTYREVADVLGISIGTVMSRVFYARQRLKAYLTGRVDP